jgi:hypothetical protein
VQFHHRVFGIVAAQFATLEGLLAVAIIHFDAPTFAINRHHLPVGESFVAHHARHQIDRPRSSLLNTTTRNTNGGNRLLA